MFITRAPNHSLVSVILPDPPQVVVHVEVVEGVVAVVAPQVAHGVGDHEEQAGGVEELLRLRGVAADEAEDVAEDADQLEPDVGNALGLERVAEVVQVEVQGIEVGLKLYRR